MNRSLLLMLTFFSLCACVSSRYIDASTVKSVPSEVLVGDAVSTKKYLDSLFATDTMENEYALIMQELRARHSGWDWKHIDLNQVYPGMSELEVFLSWGEPYKKDTGKFWVYMDDVEKAIVNFREGKVHEINLLRRPKSENKTLPNFNL